jgi:hypothetical protein
MQSPGLDLKDSNNYDNSLPFLSCTATRHVFIIDSNNPNIGKVAIIEIGMNGGNIQLHLHCQSGRKGEERADVRSFLNWRVNASHCFLKEG